MRISGHKSEASIRSYSRRLPENKQRQMAEALSSACGLQQNDKEESHHEIPFIISPQDSPSFKLSSSQFDFALDTITSSPLPQFSLPGSPVVHQSARNTVDNCNLHFGSGTFQNCNISFNFYSN